MRFDPTSLRVKLFASLALIAGIAVVATVVTILTFNGVGQSVSRLAAQNISLAAANARFAAIGQSIRVDVPELADARTQFDRNQALDRLTARFSELRALLSDAEPTSTFAESVGSILSALETNTDLLDQNVERRFAVTAQLQSQIARVNRLHGDFLFEVDPLLTDAQFNVASALSGQTGSATQGQGGILADEVAFADALGRLHANANLAVGLMLRGAVESDFQTIEALRARLSEVILDAEDNVTVLAENSSSITLRQLWTEIAAYGLGDNDLLSAKLRENALVAENAQLEEQSRELLEQLGVIVADAVRESGERSEQVAGQIDEAIGGGQAFTITSSVFMLALLLGFSIFYVRGQLFRRLTRVLDSMRKIADGQKKVAVQVEGADEVGQLADAVRLFRHKSEALDQRAEDLRKTNVALSAEISLRRKAEHDLLETQAELVQAAKLAALGQLSAGIAHEFNQPLMAMGSYTHNAMRYVERGDTEKSLEKLRDIDRVVKRLSKTSNHLKTFARRPQDAATQHDLRSILNDALSLFEDRIMSAGVRLEIVQPDEEVHVLTDPGQLEQVLINLISNALDAMEDVGLPVLRIEIGETARRASVAITDNGSGLSEEVRKRLFDPFFTTKPPGQGLGLGLSISYNVVRDLGGRLEILPGEDCGTVAKVELFKS